MFTVGGAVFTVGGVVVYSRRSNTKLLWTSVGPKYEEKKSPGFDKIIVLIMKDE